MKLTEPATASTAPGRAATWIRPLAVASLVVNILIVLTGGVVRLTDPRAVLHAHPARHPA